MKELKRINKKLYVFIGTPETHEVAHIIRESLVSQHRARCACSIHQDNEKAQSQRRGLII